MMKLISLLPFILLCVSLTGCGDGTLRVNGNITFPDGAPLTKGVVVFATDTYTNKGTLDANGRYSISVPAGQYKVYIALAAVLDETFVAPPHEPDALRHIPLVHASFTTLESTPLTCDIKKSGMQNFTVEPPDAIP
jgi:hypothetical protein